jgi:hypothetical protein
MGVDCNIWLPSRVRIRDVADVIGILAGLKPEKHLLQAGGEDGLWAVRVPGVTYEGITTMPECARITIDVQGEKHWTLYHFEPSNGERLLMPSSTPFWLAIGSGLVKFFGGRLQYQDCDDKIDEEYSVDYDTNPEDGEPWQAFQARMFNLQPAWPADFKQHAAYK